MSKRTSNTMRFNITLPVDIGRKVKSKPNHSALIAESLRETFAREEKERLEAVLVKAYADAAEEDKAITQEWDVTTGDNL
ncbi:MAG: hypothetical protein ACR2FM_00185 [Candidatus Saccharimonadales bacterium]